MAQLRDIGRELASDIRADIQKRLTRRNLSKAERKVLDQLDELKNRETRRGKSPAKGGRWNNVYNRQYAKRRKGGRRSPVTLRNRRKRIERTEIQSGTKRTTLRFRNKKMAQVFWYHHTGQAKGGKTRQVYPKRDREVPREIDKTAELAVLKILQ